MQTKLLFSRHTFNDFTFRPVRLVKFLKLHLSKLSILDVLAVLVLLFLLSKYMLNNSKYPQKCRWRLLGLFNCDLFERKKTLQSNIESNFMNETATRDRVTSLVVGDRNLHRIFYPQLILKIQVQLIFFHHAINYIWSGVCHWCLKNAVVVLSHRLLLNRVSATK